MGMPAQFLNALACCMQSDTARHHPALIKAIAGALKVQPTDIVDFDLNVCDTQPGVIGGESPCVCLVLPACCSCKLSSHTCQNSISAACRQGSVDSAQGLCHAGGDMHPFATARDESTIEAVPCDRRAHLPDI